MMRLSSLIVVSCVVVAAGCNKPADRPQIVTSTEGTTSGAPVPPVKQGISKLTKLTTKDVKVGDGLVLGVKVGNNKPIANGDLVSLQYTGKLQDGKVFDSNVPGYKVNGQKVTYDKPLVITVGRGDVVQGMEQGVIGMKVGGVRDIGIPPSLGYGEQGRGEAIPPNSDMLFNVKVLDIVKPGEEGYFDFKDLKIGSGRPIKENDTVQIEYTQKLVDGTLVESNVGKEPTEFTIASEPPQVISGLERGVIGMKKGGERILRIPPGIGYGGKYIEGGVIPPNSTLIIQVKILEVM